MSERDSLLGAERDYGAASSDTFPQFSPTELYSLKENIAQSVDSINASLRSLQRMSRALGRGANDNPTLRENIHTTQQDVNVRVANTARDLQRLVAVVRRADKPEKLQVERLTNSFKEALASYSDLQKQIRDKLTALPPPKSQPAPLVDLAAEQDEEATLLANQQAQTRLLEWETSMLLEREAYMSRVEADVIDVNQIMAELADIVHSQGQTIDTIESQIESADARVSEGVDEVAKAATYQARYRRKLLILLVCALIAGIILVIVLVRTLR